MRLAAMGRVGHSSMWHSLMAKLHCPHSDAVQRPCKDQQQAGERMDERGSCALTQKAFPGLFTTLANPQS